jgi:hypothetical protein
VHGGIAGTPCSVVYKYGELALQVGVWAVGPQSINVKKLILRKPKFLPLKNGQEWRVKEKSSV